LAGAREQGRLKTISTSLEQESMANSFRTAKRVWRLLRRLHPALAASALALSSVASAETSPRAGEVAGRYSILRAEDKDTGCMLTLDTRGRGPGGFKAQLAPACRDNGVVIFDPVGWSLDRGRLALVARKGHKTYFELQPGRIWRRDPKEGKDLSLKPLK
jgi:hypothetical protein